MLAGSNGISQISPEKKISHATFDPTKSTQPQIDFSPGYSAVSITSALDSSREYSRPSTSDETTFTTNTARSIASKSTKSDVSIMRTLMSINAISPVSLGSAPRTPYIVGSVQRLATAHGDKHQAAQFKAATDRAQTEGPRTLAQVEMHLGIMRQRASDISKSYAKLTSLSSLLTLQRQYSIALQNLESENKMILSLVDKVIQGGSTQKVLSAIKQLKPIMQMMQSPLIDRMPFAQFNQSCTDHVKEEIQNICVRLSETNKQKVHASSFIPWNTEPSETWVSDKAMLLTQIIDQQLDAVGDQVLGDVMKLYDVNQKLTRMCLRLQGENDILKVKMSEVISKIPDKKVSAAFSILKMSKNALSHRESLATHFTIIQEQRSILKSMDMPVLNDDPNSHDLFRSANKLPSMAGAVCALTAASQLKSTLGTSDVDRKGIDTKSLEQNSTKSDRRPSKSTLGFTASEQ